MTKHRIGVLVLLAALVFCGLALAGPPGKAQYENPMDHEGAPPTPTGPRLPFTGFQAGMVLMAGFAALGAGLVLRHTAVEHRVRSRLVVATPAGEELDATFLTRRLERCEVCGKPFDPMGFRISIGAHGRSFDSVECAARAQARSAPG